MIMLGRCIPFYTWAKHILKQDSPFARRGGLRSAGPSGAIAAREVCAGKSICAGKTLRKNLDTRSVTSTRRRFGSRKGRISKPVTAACGFHKAGARTHANAGAYTKPKPFLRLKSSILLRSLDFASSVSGNHHQSTGSYSVMTSFVFLYLLRVYIHPVCQLLLTQLHNKRALRILSPTYTSMGSVSPRISKVSTVR